MTPVSDAEMTALLELSHTLASYWWHKHGGVLDRSDYESAGHEALAQALAWWVPGKAALTSYLYDRCRSVMGDLRRQGMVGSARAKIPVQVLLDDQCSGIDRIEPARRTAWRQWEAQCTPPERATLMQCALHGSQAGAARALGLTEACISQRMQALRQRWRAGVV